MPQATNRKLLRDMGGTPTGKGTVYTAMLASTAKSRERLLKQNDSEAQKLQKITNILDKNCRTSEVMYRNVIDKTKKRLREIEAFQKVVTEDYRIDKFRTLQIGFAPETSRISTRRLAVETRFYYAGFCMTSLKPEIERKLRLMDPERGRTRFKRRLLEHSRRETSSLTKLERSTSVMLDTVRQWRNKRQTLLPPK